jgi:hypothetical protein
MSLDTQNGVAMSAHLSVLFQERRRQRRSHYDGNARGVLVGRIEHKAYAQLRSGPHQISVAVKGSDITTIFNFFESLTHTI